jgi:hypothetical protein
MTRVIASLVCLSLAGCAMLTQPIAANRRAGAPVRPADQTRAIEDGYEDYAGVIHVHTTYSHDAHGSFEDAVRVANAQQLDFIIFTEHNTLQPIRDGRQGWYGAALALIGMEISTSSGHYIAMNVHQEIDREGKTAQQIIDEVNAQGGFGFIAHPYFKRGRWLDWSVTGFTGIEAYNVAHDTLDENRMRLVVWTLTAPVGPFYFSILDRPYDPLAKWDELLHQHGNVVGIGSTDAHEFHLAGIKIAPYEAMFQLIRTHVLLPEGELTDHGVYDALRRGHAYFAIELVAEAKGFQFLIEGDRGVIGTMGDEILLEPNLRLRVSLPAPAQMMLFKDGSPIASTTGQAWEYPVTEGGTYRLEASRHGKPWIFSNPIYIRQGIDIPPG